MDLKKEIEKVGKNLTVTVEEKYIIISHKDFDFEYEFDRSKNNEDILSEIKDFIST